MGILRKGIIGAFKTPLENYDNAIFFILECRLLAMNYIKVERKFTVSEFQTKKIVIVALNLAEDFS